MHQVYAKGSVIVVQWFPVDKYNTWEWNVGDNFEKGLQGVQ